VYRFFEPPKLCKDDDGRSYQSFKCAAPKGCKSKVNATSRYQTNKDGSKAADRSSTSNLMKHAKKCWGADIVKARMQGVDAQAKDGSIFSAFARANERPITHSQKRSSGTILPHLHSQTLTTSNLRAHIVRWVVESNRPLVIVEDREFKFILGAGRPEYRLPGRRTVSRDLNASYERCRTFVEQLLKEHPGRLSFGTDAWTSPNHRAFVVWTVHLHHKGELVSFPLDIFEVPEV
ncbi:hypothetical protein B0H17DRAFT_844915, partial [Mycena rosella]